MDQELNDKAFWITHVVYTRLPNDTMEAHEDRLYRTVDNLLFLTEDQKAEFYARLAESLTKDMPFRDAHTAVTNALTKVLHG